MTPEESEFVGAVKAPSRREVLGKIADLLDSSGIDVDEVGRIHRVNLWQMGYKDADGEARSHDLVGVQLTPKWDEGPSWPVVQPAPTVAVRPLKIIDKKTHLK